MSITLAAMALYALAKRRRKKMSMDADALLTRIENIVAKPEAASAPVSVSPINWRVARAQVTRARKRIKPEPGMANGVHPGGLASIRDTLARAKAYIAAPKPAGWTEAKSRAHTLKLAREAERENAKRRRAAKKAARIRAANDEKRQKAAEKAARTRAENAEKKRQAIIKAKRTRTINANKKAKAQRKRTRTIRRKHGRK